MLPIFTTPQGQQRPNIMYILQSFQQWHQMHQVRIRRVIDPSLNRNRIV